MKKSKKRFGCDLFIVKKDKKCFLQHLKGTQNSQLRLIWKGTIFQ